MPLQKKNPWTPDQALAHLQKLCAVEDRCHFDLRKKLIEHQIYGDEAEEILAELISEGFLNEERYARAYIRGKYRQKAWGRNKIRTHLKQKQVSDYCIKKGMQEIDDEEYFEILTAQASKKHPLIREKDERKRKQKLINFLMSRGYEYHLITEVIPLPED